MNRQTHNIEKKQINTVFNPILTRLFQFKFVLKNPILTSPIVDDPIFEIQSNTIQFKFQTGKKKMFPRITSLHSQRGRHNMRTPQEREESRGCFTIRLKMNSTMPVVFSDLIENDRE